MERCRKFCAFLFLPNTYVLIIYIAVFKKNLFFVSANQISLCHSK